MTGSIGPYRILRELGAGGMGEVFLAEDERLGRRVALKSPSDDWLKQPDARVRLHREARAAAQLSHPNIATVYDVLDEGGRPYIVMEYIEGESLSKTASTGPLPVEKALAIGRQIADGLSVAHAAGIIHRDLKPANVMLTPSGQVKLLDFGVARMVDPVGEPLTAAGQVVGTPGYVPPEQLLGRPADARSDIYSTGMILYQLLSGRAPWVSSGDGRAIETLLTGVRDLHQVAPNIPPSVSDIVMRAVAREPQDRYQTATDFGQALETAAASLREMPTVATGQALPVSRRRLSWTIGVGLLVLLALAGMPYVLRGRSGGEVTARTLPVVAVLPLTNLSGDPKLEYVGAGMAETMSTKLANVSGLAVVSRGEIHDALARSTDITKVSRALGVAYIVSGSIQQADNRIQVTINLLSPDGARIVEGAMYNDTIANLFALQRQISEDLALRLTGRVSLSSQDRQQLARMSTNNVSAISAYWRGKGLLEQPGPAPIDPAIAAFIEATTADGSFALGYAGLGSAYWRKYEQTKDPQWAGKAVEANEHARQLSSDEAEVRLSLATVYNGIGRPRDAIAELERVLALQPTSDRAHRLLGDIYAASGKTSEAEAQFAAAIKIRPEYWATYRSLGYLLMKERRYDEAVRAFTKVTERQPDSTMGYQLLGNAHSQLGDFDAARADYEAANRRGGSPATSSSLGTVAYYQGRYADAARQYLDAIAQRPNNGKTHWNLADAYRRLDRQDEARSEYEKAVSLFDADLGVNSRDALARAIRATCVARLGRMPEALRESARAVADAPSNDEVLYQRALVLTLAHQPRAAVEALDQSVKNGRSVFLLARDTDVAELRVVPGFQSIVRASAQSGNVDGQSPRRDK